MVDSIKIIAPKHGKGRKIIEIDGEKFVYDKATEKDLDDILHFKKLEESKDYEKTVEEVAQKISKRTDVKKLIKQALHELPYEDYLKIKEEMEKEKPKIRNNEGCFSLSIGKQRLHLRD